MRRLGPLALGLLCLTLLIITCFFSVLFRDEQFAYRDAAHFYYPLYLRVQRQWEAGHIPLWDPGENGGLPMIGNPTAAVFYPVKLVFFALPYPWAMRAYLIGHVVLAFVAMYLWIRQLNLSRTAATLAGMSYAFGGPVLFQYANAIFLVGAAWLPLGFLAADRWLRRGSIRSIALLAFALAMLCLGGDFEAAYLLGGYSAVWATGMTLRRSSHGPKTIVRPIGWFAIAGIVAIAWVVLTLASAAWFRSSSHWGLSSTTATWVSRLGKLAVFLAMGILIGKRVKDRAKLLIRALFGLLAAAVVGFAIAGPSLAPVAELAARSFRMSSEANTDFNGFSLEPYRLVEFAFPWFFGIEIPQDKLWLLAISTLQPHALWVPSLYLGGLTLVLAVGGMSARSAPRWRTPVAILAISALVFSTGRMGSPLWWSQLRLGATTSQLTGDEWIRDGFGSPYWILAALAPGFSGFRYPSKLLVFVAFGISSLAALGWDEASIKSRKTAWILAGIGLISLFVTLPFAGVFVSWLDRHAKVPTVAGPIDPIGALFELRRSLIHGVILFGLSGWLLSSVKRGRNWTNALAIGLMAADLAIANSRMIWSVPQAEFDRVPNAAKVILDAEKKRPARGPFRIERLPEWHPVGWFRSRSPERLRQVIAWERDTLQSGHGMLYGLSYTLVPGVIEPEAYLQFFQPRTIPAEPEGAHMIGIEPGKGVSLFPRRAFDLWGSRYFILPVQPTNWLEPNRALAAFVSDVEVLLPDPSIKRSLAQEAEWVENQDWQVFFNPNHYPRVWIVHDALVRKTISDPDSQNAKNLKREILYRRDAFDNIPGRAENDPHALAWIEVHEPRDLKLDLSGLPPDSLETIEITRNEPARIEMKATLKTPGLVVLADSFYPGWRLSIDGMPATILQTNRVMRGAAVKSGTHSLVYSYEPASFQIGLFLGLFGCLALIGLCFVKVRFETTEL